MLIGVICSDARMIQIANNLSVDMHVIHIDETTDFLTLPMLDALVFPVKGMDAYEYINFETKRVHIPSAFWNTQGNQMRIFCGLPCEALRNKPQEINYYMHDDEVTKANAILTAEGVLYEFISCVCKSIYALQVDVVGYGCCGKEIYQMLKNLNVSARVIRRVCEKEEDMITFQDWNTCGDVVINTAPVNWLSEEQLKTWQKPFVLLDIASGDIFDKALLKKIDITYKKIPNLPGRFACITAGNIIAEYIRGKCHGK